jgi:hypothetical protein
MKRTRAILASLVALAFLACEARSHAPGGASGSDADGTSSSTEDARPIDVPPSTGDSARDMTATSDAGGDAPVASDTTGVQAVCGNGLIESGEQCDPVTTCPASCPSKGCTTFTLQGSASDCTAVCAVAQIQTSCVHDDGCCPSICNATSDRDCAVKCGNGIKEGAETCDPVSSCPTSCPAMGCQLRRLINAGTCTAECVNDRQQTSCNSGDGCCPAACNSTNDGDCAPRCDNGVIESGETCDPVSSCSSKQAACVSDKETLRTPAGLASKCTFVCQEIP